MAYLLYFHIFSKMFCRLLQNCRMRESVKDKFDYFHYTFIYFPRCFVICCRFVVCGKVLSSLFSFSEKSKKIVDSNDEEKESIKKKKKKKKEKVTSYNNSIYYIQKECTIALTQKGPMHDFKLERSLCIPSINLFMFCQICNFFILKCSL